MLRWFVVGTCTSVEQPFSILCVCVSLITLFPCEYYVWNCEDAQSGKRRRRKSGTRRKMMEEVVICQNGGCSTMVKWLHRIIQFTWGVRSNLFIMIVFCSIHPSVCRGRICDIFLFCFHLFVCCVRLNVAASAIPM